MLLAGAALPTVALALKAPPTKTTTTPTKSTTTTVPGATTPTTTTTSNTKVGIRWHKPIRIERSNWGGLDSVACPSVKLCVAVDQSGQVLWSKTPAGTRHWHLVKADLGHSLTSISCPTTTFCAAVDDSGRMIWTNTPTGGRRKWSKPARIDTAEAPGGGPAGLTSISCTIATSTSVATTTTPTTTGPTPTVPPLCVATDGAPQGSVVVSTHPTGGRKAWVAAQIGSTSSLGGTLASVTCLATTFCLAAGSQHYYSTDPAGGASAWHASGGPTAGGLLASVACPAATMCVAVGYGNSSIGLSDVTAKPTGGLTDWITTAVTGTPPVIGAGLVDSVACPSTGLCIAVDSFDHAYTTTTPQTGAWVGGAAIRKDSAAQWSSISCQKTFCMVVDSAGVGTAGIVRGA